jgi:hypothetical protein
LLPTILRAYNRTLKKNVYNSSFSAVATAKGITKLSLIGANSIIVATIATTSAISHETKNSKIKNATAKQASVPSSVLV